ncbi:hypothetical protein CSQ96_21200 [Janthinobacterium sp. BJB412]|nr:hypothetical protein CSQ96_21200 [Janthinobacterium sp. BJB412]
MVVDHQTRHVGLSGEDAGAFFYDGTYSYKRDRRDEGPTWRGNTISLEGLPNGLEPGFTKSYASLTTSVVGDTLNYSSKVRAESGAGDHALARSVAEWNVGFTLTKGQSYKLSLDSYMEGFDQGWSWNPGYDFSLAKIDYVNGVKVSTIIFDNPLMYTQDGPVHKFDKLFDLSAGEYAIHAAGTATGVLQYNPDLQGWQQFALAPVPEPTTWGMLALGLGVVGFAAKRRKAGAASAA